MDVVCGGVVVVREVDVDVGAGEGVLVSADVGSGGDVASDGDILVV